MSNQLRIAGRLYPDNRLVLRPGYTIDWARAVQPGGPVELTAEVLDDQDEAIVRAPLLVKRFSSGFSLAVRGSIELPDSAARLVVWRTDDSGRGPIAVASVEVPPSAPEVRLSSVPEGAVDGQHRLSWTFDGDPPPVEYVVDYSHDDGMTWQPVSRRLVELETTIDLDVLPGGESCRVAVTATNGIRSQTVISEPFQVPPKPCRALIQLPADGDRVAPDVTLAGNGWWLEESRVEAEQLRWASDVDGDLGEGHLIRTRLSPGPHTLTLTAGDGSRAGAESVSVEVLDE